MEEWKSTIKLGKQAEKLLIASNQIFYKYTFYTDYSWIKLTIRKETMVIFAVRKFKGYEPDFIGDNCNYGFSKF